LTEIPAVPLAAVIVTDVTPGSGPTVSMVSVADVCPAKNVTGATMTFARDGETAILSGTGTARDNVTSNDLLLRKRSRFMALGATSVRAAAPSTAVASVWASTTDARGRIGHRVRVGGRVGRSGTVFGVLKAQDKATPCGARKAEANIRRALFFLLHCRAPSLSSRARANGEMLSAIRIGRSPEPNKAGLKALVTEYVAKIHENLALPLRKHKNMSQKEALSEGKRLLRQVHMQDFADKYPSELGDGMRKRVAIARALTLDPRYVLFDEPTTSLDAVSARRVDKFIFELSDSLGVTSIVVSHELVSIFSIAKRIVMLYKGHVRTLGSQDEFKACQDGVVHQFIRGEAQGPMEM
jgi:ABC-type dipeptide/oligopeptide/nickel transport system ATPase component